MLTGRLGERLNLTDEQKQQIKAILEANEENIDVSRNAVREAMMALNEAAEGGVEAEIIAAGKAVGDAFTEQALQRANIAKQVKAVLTEEQLAQLDEIKAQMKERMQQRRQNRWDDEGPRSRRRSPKGPRPEFQDAPAED
jgi:Spy/CpxP family protein refolding chaperone